MEIENPVEFLICSIFAGLLGSGGMTLFLNLVTKLEITNAKMILAVGSLITKSTKNAMLVGWIIHLVSGIIFGIFYTFVITRLAPAIIGVIIGAGILLGFLHGLIASIGLVAVIAEQHPLKEFQDAGLDVALAHAVGHIIFGLIVGLVIVITGIAGTG